MGKRNCWDVIRCGRHSNCPAYPDYGRDCFAVTATICRGREQGSCEEKIALCRECDFYKGIMEAKY